MLSSHDENTMTLNSLRDTLFAVSESILHLGLFFVLLLYLLLISDAVAYFGGVWIQILVDFWFYETTGRAKILIFVLKKMNTAPKLLCAVKQSAAADTVPSKPGY